MCEFTLSSCRARCAQEKIAPMYWLNIYAMSKFRRFLAFFVHIVVVLVERRASDSCYYKC